MTAKRLNAKSKTFEGILVGFLSRVLCVLSDFLNMSDAADEQTSYNVTAFASSLNSWTGRSKANRKIKEINGGNGDNRNTRRIYFRPDFFRFLPSKLSQNTRKMSTFL